MVTPMLGGKNAAILALVLTLLTLVSMLWNPPPIEGVSETSAIATTVVGSITPRMLSPAEKTAVATALPANESNVSIPWILKVKLPKVKPRIGFLQALIRRVEDFIAWLTNLFTLPSEHPRNTSIIVKKSKEDFLIPGVIIASAMLTALSAYIIVLRRRTVRRDRMITPIMHAHGERAERSHRGLKEPNITSPENELVSAIKVLAKKLSKDVGREPDVITHREVLQLIRKHQGELSEDLRVSAVNAVRYYELWRFAGRELRGEWLEEARRVVARVGDKNESTA